MAELKDTYADPQIHDRWEDVYRGNPRLERLTNAILARALTLAGPAAGTLFLDAGCGIGAHTRRIAASGHRCVGVDISPHILRQAVQRSGAAGLGSQTAYACTALEALPFAPATFGMVHCRGVLMHIPDWGRALDNLCRVVKPGGCIIIIENNDRSLFARGLLAARSIAGRFAQSQMVRTEGGVEFWSRENGRPFVVRLANVDALARRLEANGFETTARFGTSLLDVERVRAGWPRAAVVALNHTAFRLGVPAALCKGNVLIGRRRA
jgi:ubiquinone/menaquinone biosynthesis C-methylase UbiE